MPLMLETRSCPRFQPVLFCMLCWRVEIEYSSLSSLQARHYDWKLRAIKTTLYVARHEARCP